MLSRAVLRLPAVCARSFHSSRLLAQQAVAPAATKAFSVDPSNPEIAPSTTSTREYKNEYYKNRGYTVAPKEWKEWSDMPESAGIFRYLGVKVDPEHVLKHGPIWSFFSDYRTALPTAVLLSLPLWMFNVLPPFDERMELAGIGLAATMVAVKAAGPMFRAWKRSRVATKVK